MIIQPKYKCNVCGEPCWITRWSGSDKAGNNISGVWFLCDEHDTKENRNNNYFGRQ